MLTVDKSLILNCRPEEAGMFPLDDLKTHKKYGKIRFMEEFWNREVVPRAGHAESIKLFPTFKTWVEAPIKYGRDEGSFLSLASSSPFARGTLPATRPLGGGFWPELALQSTQDKNFESCESLIKALKGNLAATGSRHKEELLSLDILANLEFYEGYVLNDLINTIQDQISAKKYNKPREGTSYYGSGAIVSWSDNIVRMTADDQPLLRLYKKVAALHDFCRCNRFDTPGRNDHADMRMPNEKYSLNENNAHIMRERRLNNSVWAGKSGSAMDIIYGAKQVGLNDDDKLGALSFCIVAFFHYMPTSQSSTHTYHEVMSGATSIHSAINKFYSPSEVPSVQVKPHSYFLSRPRTWMNDNNYTECTNCGVKFGLLTRKHHCRECGIVFCANCTTHTKSVLMPAIRPGKTAETGMLRVCDSCFRK